MAEQHDRYSQAVAGIRQQTDLKPQVAIVLGSGLGSLADEITDPVVIPYSEIPGIEESTVEGHSGELVFGRLRGVKVVAQRGRLHFYEGYTPQQITFPIRVMYRLGAETLIVSNAAGGIHKGFEVGDLMLINDHINFLGMAGFHPLVGHNDESFGPRFVGMSRTYDVKLRNMAHKAAKKAGVVLREGVYCALSGPSFETPAEIRMLRTLGAAAVGMSTVHEVTVARHAGMRVLAFSGITNVAVDKIDSKEEANHEEVLAAGKTLAPKLVAVVKGVLKAL